MTPSLPTADPMPAAGPSPQRQTWLFVLVVCCVLFAMTGWRQYCARNSDLAQSQVTTDNMARALADHTQAVIDAADIVLDDLIERLRAETQDAAAIDRLRRILRADVASIPALHLLMVFSEQGDMTMASFDPMLPMNVADRAYFAYHRDNLSAAPIIGPPIRGRVDGRWSLTVSRRIDRADGMFGGVAVAVIDCETFSQFYSQFDVGAHGVITLLNDQDTIVVRYPLPSDPTVQGRKSTQSLWHRGPAGHGRLISPLDGLARVYSFHRAGGTSLMVAAGLSEDEVLRAWRHDTEVDLLLCLAVSAALSLLGWRLGSQISRHERRKELLRRADERYRLLAEHSSDVIIQLGPDRRAQYVSPSSERVLGYRPWELVDRDPGEVAHPEDQRILAENIAEILHRGHAHPVIYRFRTRNGEYAWVEALGRKLEGELGLVLAVRDVTLRKQAEEQLLRAQRMEAMGQLTAGVAHDFNNMLQIQSGALELLVEEVKDRAPAVELANLALSAGERGAALTHSLLSFSRQQILRPVPVALPAILARMQSMLAPVLGPNIVLRVDAGVETGWPLADPAHLETALLNLALNARDAMPKGGCLSIKACNAAPDLLPPDTTEPREYMLITVSDDGVGMSAETVRRACDPFFTTKGIGQGSGLGLSMVQGFAKQSDGLVTIQSALGVGTSVELWLPIVTERMAAIAPPGRGGVQTGRILLVEDVAEIAETMAALLESSGFEVVCAASGEAALKQIESGQDFDVLVTDFAMPGMNGGDLVRLARLIRPSMAAVIVTGYVEFDQSHDIPPRVEVLRKPIRADALIAHLQRLIKPKEHAEMAELRGP